MRPFRAAGLAGLLAAAMALTPSVGAAQQPAPFTLPDGNAFGDTPFGDTPLGDGFDERVTPEEEPTAPVEQAEPDRADALADFYARLADAPDRESAEAAAEAIERLWLRSGSDTVDLLMSRARGMIEEREFDVALKLLDAVVALDPEYPEGWHQRATVKFFKRDYASSLRDLRAALRLDPQHFRAIGGLALIFQELGETEAALTAYRKALEAHPYLDDARRAVRDLAREVEGQGI